MSHIKDSEDEWKIVGGKLRYHTKPICDIIYIPQFSPNQQHQQQQQQPVQMSVPRLVSLGEDRVNINKIDWLLLVYSENIPHKYWVA
jgi:hypothetical protein